MSAPLSIGDEAFCFLYEVAGAERKTLLGAARVRVLEIAESGEYVVEIVAATGGVPGHKLTRERAALYAEKDRAENAAFGREVRRFWPSRAELAVPRFRHQPHTAQDNAR